jgi:predicted NBD/HSP70 family sugar kinase
MPEDRTPQARHWRSAAAALELVRRRPTPTRRELALELGLASGPTSDLVGRLRAARLVAERPAAVHGPGRPTTRLHVHPDGPVVLAVDLRHGDWRVAVCGLDGEPEQVSAGIHRAGSAVAVLRRLRRVITQAVDQLADRVLAVGVAVPGLTAGTRVLEASMLGWRDVELKLIAGGLPVIAGNDATMAAVAEARMQPEAGVLLHLVLEVGVGGALILDGRPTQGARGLAGEFGHLPFGDPDLACGCGARGCWGLAFDPRRLASRLGQGDPADPRGWLRRFLDSARPTAEERGLRERLAADFGRGTAGLVNALDPHVVTLGGLAGPLRDAAPDVFEHAFGSGLMSAHRRPAPEIVTGRAGEDGVLVGTALATFDRILDAPRLARWATRAA